MSRGRLIRPFLVTIARLDTHATAADPDGSGDLEAGYDDEFREPVIVPPSDTESSARGTVNRVESTVQLHAQIEEEDFMTLRMMSTGNSPNSLIRCVLHFKELEAEGLVDDNGMPKLNVNDRLTAIHDRNGNLVMNVPDNPGLYCTEAQPRGHGLGYKRNLLLMTFEERPRSV
jgi:hypothetical protein